MLEPYLDTLRLLVRQKNGTKEDVKKLEHSLFLSDHELAGALYGVLCKQVGMPIAPLNFQHIASGAVPLFKRGYFPWGSLPYPKEHAELGVACAFLEMKESAETIARWQSTFASDHHQNPIYALFSQEKGWDQKGLEEAHQALFNLYPHPIQESCQAVDEELGLVISKSKAHTALSAAAGCKSGMGCFLYQDVGVINFGPQALPLGECESFGLAGKPLYFEHTITKEGFLSRYQTRLAAVHPRKSPLSSLKDSGYSGFWGKVETEFKNASFSISCTLEGEGEIEERAFVFFGKGNACFVAGTHKLNPRSLNRYQGPPQPVAFHGGKGKVVLEALEGAKAMQVIPLAGDAGFWGADFLVAFTYASLSQRYHLEGIESSI